ncbi:MAG TPA: hypothetical protein P5102_12360 [Candidatus Competibacteraceae bacterium]|nr:hypothetical protein [Candidatus Competibacteraceae bacterium]HRZ06920.1 hypothetical protein [Candidatus Competibacteraceae bacterium]HSA46550.1 hypothetical protein [Candidatus Competibacteraceae bacterium]
MNLQTAVNQNQEQILIKIIRNLPPSRVDELLDFARFLEGQILAEKLTQGEDSAQIEADNDRWDALLATDESQKMLECLSNEALNEHRSGKTKPMKFSNKGRIMPG